MSSQPSASASASTTTTTSTSTSSKRTLRTNRKSPQRFVARPSKYGLNNDEGDTEFLQDDTRFNSTNSTAAEMKELLPPSSASSVSASTIAKVGSWKCHKCASANPAERSRCEGCLSWKGGRRENYPSSISSPTTKKKKQRDASDTKQKVGSWSCHKCNNINLAERSRCGECLSWKDGHRENYPSTIASSSPASKKKKSASSSRRSSSKEESSEKKKKKKSAKAIKGSWSCHKCDNTNPSERSRCEECLSWKGGHRDNYPSTISSPTKKRADSAKKQESKQKADEVTKQSGKSKTEGTKKKGCSSLENKTSDSSSKKATAAASRSNKRKRESTSNNTGDKEGRRQGNKRAAASAIASTTSTAASSQKQQNQSHTMAAYSKRKSNKSRRPRQLRPTEKMVAMHMQEELVVETKKMKAVSQPSSAAATASQKKTNKKQPTSSSARKRQCGKCTPCKLEDCGNCKQCKDKKKFGGEGKMKQRCIMRKCIGNNNNATTDIDNHIMGAANVRTNVGGGKGSDSKSVNADESDDDDDDESCYDDVVCCLCKCAVDFSDKDFFTPEKKKTEECNDDKAGIECDEEEEDDKPAFQIPYSFHNPANALILCDGPVHVGKRRDNNNETVNITNGSNSNGPVQTTTEYKCERAYHQQCHFVPVMTIPRGPWRCLICTYRDEEYLKERSTKSGNGSEKADEGDTDAGAALSDAELNAIFRCVPIHNTSPPVVNGGGEMILDEANGGGATKSDEEDETLAAAAKVLYAINGVEQPAKQREDIVRLERRFEFITTDLKSSALHEELTSRSRTLIKSTLRTMRTSQHALRTFTETSKSRKSLADRIELARREQEYEDDSDGNVGVRLGLPQELSQCIMRIAVCKMRVRELIMGLEHIIRCRPYDVNELSCNLKIDEEDKKMGTDDDQWRDSIGDLMQWYLREQQSQPPMSHVNTTMKEYQPPTKNMSLDATDTKDSKSLLHHLFPEGNLSRRRYEPRTGEAHLHEQQKHGKMDGNDASSVTSISLDDLRCSQCHGHDASDDNDMLLCDGIGCYRSYHMQCLEPKVVLDDVEKEGEEDKDWFCPLCTAHATLIHYAESENFGDDPEENEEHMEEWEMASHVFSEAPFELRVAEKFKRNIFDDETRDYLADTLGIGSGAGGSSSSLYGSNSNERLDLLAEDDDSDDDFDHEEEMLDDKSVASDNNMEQELGKERIGKDELNDIGVSDSDNSDSDDSSSNNKGPAPRRSKRKRFTLHDASEEEESSRSKSPIPKDIGTLDVANIVRGKRNRTQVDYRKLADAVFGDDIDEDATGSKKEYNFKPPKSEVGSSSEDESDNESAEESADSM